ncbi:MAG TPA: YerC/YecD family TrpR-related protein [Candidatus Dojkabacteria bacterium]|nr:YerC/YecD family TrpR-related protein [Candidatus Dojkabacteria bacterium]HRO65218.1 YerC/YecD family TrpR-related protein [Candidatus Dojkabacteria bacterium]HRP37170.1 YerC/YecD family TrpR-related protein [Candidatus Dojkabacteria bacterium]HRP51246.1 YerC/YecD family TrpR-related protein [Candidatus Dojkabacteria bacterium]
MDKEIDISTLVEAISKLKNDDEIEAFLSDILTKSEQQTLTMRLKVAKLLDKGSPYKQIERETGASSATIAKISEYLKYGYDGYRTVIERLDNK